MRHQRIYRYELPVTDYPELVLPIGARVLSVGPSRHGDVDLLDLWAVVDPVASLAPRPFRVVGTGQMMPPDCGRFVGTVVTAAGRFVWHVFEGGAD